MGDRIRLCDTTDVPAGTARRFDVGEHRIALIRVGDAFYALGDRCSHADYSLSEGEVYPEDLEIECWKHGSTFSLESGEPQSLPATKPVRVYEVRIEDGDVVVEVS
jgi:3-phenylpropionate/trans-cinnamate dioxygenase ferredoxin subunit